MIPQKRIFCDFCIYEELMEIRRNKMYSPPDPRDYHPNEFTFLGITVYACKKHLLELENALKNSSLYELHSEIQKALEDQDYETLLKYPEIIDNIIKNRFLNLADFKKSDEVVLV